MNKRQFIEKVKNEGFVILDKDGNTRFYCVKVNKDNFNDMPEKLVEQLEKAGMYDNCYVPIITEEQPPFGYILLPVFGNNDKYVLDNFYRNEEDAIKSYLNVRSIALLKRANEFEEENVVDMR